MNQYNVSRDRVHSERKQDSGLSALTGTFYGLVVEDLELDKPKEQNMQRNPIFHYRCATPSQWSWCCLVPSLG